MRVMVDTNIILSAALFPNIRMDGIIEFIVKHHSLIISDLVVTEFIEVAGYDKFNKVAEAEDFLKKLSFTTYTTPKITKLQGVSIRDDKDYGILFAAIKSKADVFLTRDKDFLECGVMKPHMMTINEFESVFILAERTRHESLGHFQKTMDKVPHTEPEPQDRL
jgi:putative PIN family toxin of toxin-antitoxin system